MVEHGAGGVGHPTPYPKIGFWSATADGRGRPGLGEGQDNGWMGTQIQASPPGDGTSLVCDAIMLGKGGWLSKELNRLLFDAHNSDG